MIDYIVHRRREDLGEKSKNYFKKPFKKDISATECVPFRALVVAHLCYRFTLADRYEKDI